MVWPSIHISPWIKVCLPVPDFASPTVLLSVRSVMFSKSLLKMLQNTVPTTDLANFLSYWPLTRIYAADQYLMGLAIQVSK